MFQLLLNEDIYKKFLAERLPQVKKFIWFITADIKDLHVEYKNSFVPLIEVIDDYIDRGIAVRLIHAKEPGPRFRKDFDRFPNLIDNDLFERILCPRVHTKAVVIDGEICFIGSANLTGAGIGAKHKDKRNFEAGFVFDDEKNLNQIMAWADDLYLGNYCIDCRRRDICPDPIQ